MSSSMQIFNDFDLVLGNFGQIDMDRLLVDLIQHHRSPSNSGSRSVANSSSNTNGQYVRAAEKKIEHVIQIKHILALVEQLKPVLAKCDSISSDSGSISSNTPPLFAQYSEWLADEQFAAIQSMIDQVINSNAKFVKGGNYMRLEKCFAIKNRFNVLLDLARGVYSNSVDDVVALVKAYGKLILLLLLHACFVF